MSEDVFGNLGSELPDFVTDQPAPVEEAAPEQPKEETPAVEVKEEAPAEQPVAEAPAETPAAEETPTETPEEQAERLLAGKYRSVEELEKGYRELRDLQRRTAERAKASDMERQSLAARSLQIQQAGSCRSPAAGPG
jgi:outer membrane biosynthesis protein TonB